MIIVNFYASEVTNESGIRRPGRARSVDETPTYAPDCPRDHTVENRVSAAGERSDFFTVSKTVSVRTYVAPGGRTRMTVRTV